MSRVWPMLTFEERNKIFDTLPNGYHLFRWSNTTNTYTLTFKNNNQIINVRTFIENGMIRLDGHKGLFNSIDHLTGYFCYEPFKYRGDKIYLNKAILYHNNNVHECDVEC